MKVRVSVTGAPIISGTAQVGETPTADTSDIADADGLDNTTFTHQWLADDADTSGAADSTCTLAEADNGRTVRVRVSSADDAGNAEALVSPLTEQVARAAPTEAPAGTGCRPYPGIPSKEGSK